MNFDCDNGYLGYPFSGTTLCATRFYAYGCLPSPSCTHEETISPWPFLHYRHPSPPLRQFRSSALNIPLISGSRSAFPTNQSLYHYPQYRFSDLCTIDSYDDLRDRSDLDIPRRRQSRWTSSVYSFRSPFPSLKRYQTPLARLPFFLSTSPRATHQPTRSRLKKTRIITPKRIHKK